MNEFQIGDFRALYFISDAHFGFPRGSDDKLKRARLFAFGNAIALPGNYLFILGDLFDFWFEWRRVIPKRHFRVLRELAAWVDRGLKIHYLPGNHDFRLGGFLEEEIGITTHPECLNFRAGGKSFHLFHGDGLLKSDSSYRLLKRVLRCRFNQRLFLLFHPDWGIKLAELSSSSSRDFQDRKRGMEDDRDYREYAGKKIREGFDFVILAHNHRPAFERIEGGVYLNTGDWHQSFSFGRFEGGELSLEFFRGEGE